MSVILNPYLGFRGNAKEATDFYHSVFGGDLIRSTFGEMNASVDPAEQDLIMHSQLTSGAINLMASDTPKHMDYTAGDNFSVSLSGAQADDATLRGYWNKLADGGTIEQPLVVAPWGDAFGMLRDRFGIRWLVNIAAA